MTLYFQLQFLKLKWTENAKSTIKNALQSEIKKVSSLKIYYQAPENKKGGQDQKRKYQENPEQEKEYEKNKYQENPENWTKKRRK